ncbi:hypothetical protein D9M68_712600 [compost metagenome]
MHRMQVEQQVDGVEHRAHGARAAQLRGIAAGVVQRGGRPYAVEVLVDEARGVGPGRVEAVIGVDVGEGERQAAAARAQVVVEQRLDGNGAADLVAVGQGVDHHVGAGLAAVEGVEVGDAGVAGGVGADVGEGDVDGVGVEVGGVGHGNRCSRGAWQVSA